MAYPRFILPLLGLYEGTDENTFFFLIVILRATTACLKVLPLAVPLTHRQRLVRQLLGDTMSQLDGLKQHTYYPGS